MQHKIIDGVTPTASSTQQGSLRNAELDALVIWYSQDDNANGMTLAESDLVTFNMTLKQTVDGERYETMILEALRFEDIIKYTNGRGGIGQIPGTNCPTECFGYLPLGNIDLNGNDELILTVNFGAVGTLTNATFYVYGVKTNKYDQDIIKYTSYTTSGTISFSDVKEVFSAGASGAGAAGNYIYITDDSGQNAELDYISWAIEMSTGKYEEDESTTTWFNCWVDDSGEGQDLNIMVKAASTELFVVSYA